MTLIPIWCPCGNLVTFSNEKRCEDCLANEWSRMGLGKPTRVQIAHVGAKQIAEGEQQMSRIKSIFARAEHERNASRMLEPQAR